ncbi:hypothetical protein RchiOBHm_Chr5g0014791 [Rosa chinensis]|uniref:Uncharacterized protein n=1 Tax=Rosa chinensis TaxID=74649 RepID=A0A2P6Q5S5_ROSCH|nr:hypothetical protein RchiOBHm_Chr5g0014791 [Rosa chinensis]
MIEDEGIGLGLDQAATILSFWGRFRKGEWGDQQTLQAAADRTISSSC